MTNKKGQVMDGLGKLGVGIAGLAITLIIAFLIISQGATQIGSIEGIDPNNATECATSVACNATGVLTEAIATIPPWVPLIVIAVIGSLLLGLIALFRR